MVKRFDRHRHAPEFASWLRVRREAEGARALRSSHVVIPTPLWTATSPALLIRRWYEGSHPNGAVSLTEQDAGKLGTWCRENRRKGERVRLTGGDRAPLEPALRRLAFIAPEAREIARACLRGEDLVHGDLRPSNIIKMPGTLAIIDTESVAIASITWDIAHLIAFVLWEESGLPQRLFDAAELSPNEKESALALARVLSTTKPCES